MISLNQIKEKLLKREKKFKKDHSSLDINFYWQLAILIIFASIPIIFFFQYQFFMEINQEYIIPISNASRQTTIKKDRIDRVLDYFSSKREKSNKIINSPVSVVDPSL